MLWSRSSSFARPWPAVMALLGLTLSAVAVAAPAAPGAASPARAAAVASPPEGVIPDLAARGWAPVLDDEFTSLDTSIWDVSVGPGLAGPGMNTREAVRIENDPDQPGDKMATITTYSAQTPSGLQHYTGEIQSGQISKGHSGFLSTYGYIEARIKLHNPPGTRSAFWLLSPTWHRAPWGDPSASGPEIDILEHDNPTAADSNPADGRCDWQTVELPCEQIAHGTLHWDGFEEDHTPLDQQVPWTGPSPQDNFITYGLLWTPDGYRMYRNGVQVFQSNEAITYNPEHIILDQFFGSSLPGAIPAGGYGDLATSPNKMAIDYVKVWQRPISEIPDRTVAANTPVAIPFSVTDHYSTSPDNAEPASVRVKVSNNTNTALVPNARITVTGNGPTDPNGSLTNAGLDSASAPPASAPNGWTTSGNAPPKVWTTRVHGGTGALRFSQPGGRAEQTITGLRPSTPYVIGAFTNLETAFTDTNGNGLYDSGEPFTEAGDALAGIDLGIVDTDAGRAGNQEVRASQNRNLWDEAGKYWAPRNDAWAEQNLAFTTGPTTTQVTFFVDNTVPAGGDARLDSDVTVDDVFLRPLAPPNRTLTLRPADNAVGDADLTLTAWTDSDDDNDVDSGEPVLGTEVTRVTFTKGSSLTNGDFESLPLGAGWNLFDNAPGAGTDVVVHDPFTLNRALELAGPSTQPDVGRRAAGTALQPVALQPNAPYTLSVRAKGNASFAFWGYQGQGTPDSDPCKVPTDCTFTTPDWSTKSITFTTDGTGKGTVVLADWDPANGPSLVDGVTLTTAAPTFTPPVVSPPLTGTGSLGEQRLVAGTPAAAGFRLGDGVQITSVTSNNQALLPDANLGAARHDPPGSGNARGVLSLTPVPDRTGSASVTVTLSGTTPTTKTIPVVVTDPRLIDPGFEQGGASWSGPTLATTGQRSGTSALRLDGTAAVEQVVTGLPDNTTFVLDAWVNGAVNVKVTTVPDSSRTPASSYTTEFPASWSGSGWTKRSLRFSTSPCPDCRGPGSSNRTGAGGTIHALPGGQVRISLTDANAGGASLVDDLQLERVPAVSPIRELSLAQSQTAFAWDTRSPFDVGRIPAGAVSSNGSLNAGVVSLATTDVVAPPSGLGEVLPDANARLVRVEPRKEYAWTLEARSTGTGQRTGRSNVTVTLTDPATGLSSSSVAAVTMNAGSLDNGDFQRGGSRFRWESRGFVGAAWNVLDRQPAQWRSSACTTSPVTWPPCPPGVPQVGPANADRVFRITTGNMAYKVTGLTAGVTYVIQASALGDGWRLEAKADDGVWGNPPSPVPIFGTLLNRNGTPIPVDAHSWAPTTNLFFTPRADDPQTTDRNESDVWIFLSDADGNANPVIDPANDDGCALFTPGELCIDDIGLFKASDLGLQPPP